MGVIIRESGMEFGEYDENQVFWIEASEQYTKSLRQNGIKSCEFILRRGNNLYFIEAKSSCPRQILAGIPSDEKEKKKSVWQVYKWDRFENASFFISVWKYTLEKIFAKQYS